MAFDFKKHLIKIQGGRDYLPVAARLIWFREVHPDWSIVTSPIEINMEMQYAIFSCTILNELGRVVATATKMENVRGFGDYLEKAETGAVGRALAYCGYGTQFAPELEESGRLASPADAPPYPAAGSPQRSVSRGSSRTSANALAGNSCSVDGCPNVLTAGQVTMSAGKFGRALCLAHQREARPTGGNGGTASRGDGRRRVHA